MHHGRRYAALLALLCGAQLHGVARAQGGAAAQPAQPVQQDLAPEPAPTGPTTPSPITDHLAFTAMYFWGVASTQGRFDPGPGAVVGTGSNTGTAFPVEGTPFTEHELGIPAQAHEPLVELMFRLAQRSRLRFDFLDLRRQGDAVLSAPLQFGAVHFAQGQSVQSELDWRQTDFTYTYSFLRNDRFELGIGPGLHLVQAYASAQVPHTSLSQVYSEAGPFATIALDGTWRLARRWSLNARGQYLKLAIDSSSGMLGDYHADVQFRAQAHLAFGAGYEYRRAQVDIRNANPSGYVQLNISGPELFARVSL